MKRMMYYGALLLALCAALLWGCDNVNLGGEQPIPVPEAMVAVYPADLVFDAAGGSKTFSISCNSTWTLEKGGDWCKPNFSFGTLNQTVTVMADAYDGIEDRNTNLTVKSGEKTAVLGVTQKGKDAILISKDKYEVAQGGGTVSVEVKSNVAVSFEIPSKFQWWLSRAEGTRAVETKTFGFTVARNDSAEVRGGYIVFSGNAVRDTVYVYQAQKDRLLLSLDTCVVRAAGDTVTVELRTNVDYDVTIPDSADWVEQVQPVTRAVRTDRLFFAVSENEATEVRETAVVVKSRTGGLSDTLFLRQAGRDFLSLTPKYHTVAQGSDTVEVTVAGNVAYSVTVPSACSSWITRLFSVSGSAQAFRISANETYAARKGFVVFAGASVRDTVYVTQAQKDRLQVSQEVYEVSLAGGTLTVGVQANVAYDVVVPDSVGWLGKPSVSSGQFTLPVLRNNGQRPREAAVTLKQRGGNLTATLVVRQKCKDFMELPNKRYTVLPAGGTVSVEVESNTAYTVTIPAAFRGWITQLSSSPATPTKKTYNFGISANEAFTAREGYVVFAGASVRDTVYITQGQKERLQLPQASYEVAAAGGTLAVSVQASVEYDVVIPESAGWITHLGSSSTQVSFSLSENGGQEYREASVTLKQRGGNLTVTLRIRQACREYLTLSHKRYTVLQAGGTATVEVASNAAYTVTIPAAFRGWITQSSYYPAAGKKIYDFSIPANETFAAREGYVVFAGTFVRDTVYITQGQKDRLQVAQAIYDVEESGGALAVSLLANVEYEVTFSSGVDWVSTSSASADRLSLGVARNDGRLPREATVTLKQRGGSLTATLRIRQACRRYLELSSERHEVAQAGGTVTVEVESNVSYTVSPNVSWISQQSSSASGTKNTYLFKVSGNETFVSREGYVAFVSATLKDTVYITQAQKDRLQVVQASYDVEGAGGTLAVSVQANVEYDVVIPAGADWLSTLASSSSQVSLSLSENNGQEPREASVTLKQRGGNLTATLVIRQAYRKYLTLSQKRYTVLQAGGTVTVEVESNLPYMVSPNVSWISQHSSSVSGMKKTYTFNVAENETFVSREGYVAFVSATLKDTVYITQAQKDRLQLSQTSYDLGTKERTLTVPLQSNVEYDVVIPSDVDWMIHLNSSATQFSLLLASNTGTKPREATVTLKQRGGGLSATLLVRQWSKYGMETAIPGVEFKMVYVEKGTFTMGATSEQGSDAYDSEKPAHSVTLTKDYYIGECEVTQGLWYAVMGTTIQQQRDKANTSWPLRGVGSNYPMYYVSWYEVQEFCTKLSQMTGKTYALPTEAQWEYAARGGRKSAGYKYSGSNTISNVAWYDSNSSSATHPVGQKTPNELGLYDMSGNVYEWCQDWYGSYSSSSQTDPTGPSSGSSRVLRGGSWYYLARFCRATAPSSAASGWCSFLSFTDRLSALLF